MKAISPISLYARINIFNYVIAHHIQQKWETAQSFAIYSAKQKRWLCRVCSEYGEGTKHWITLAVKLDQHQTPTFGGYVQSGKHTNGIQKRQEVKQV